MYCGFRFFCLGLFLGACLATVFFEENFNDPDCLESWVSGSSPEHENGKFELHARNFSDDVTNLGLVTMQDARFYWLSRKFERPFSNNESTLVIQLTVSFQQEIDCGGGYIKLYDVDTNQKELNGSTPYYIMFGPDVCKPVTEVVHAIFAYKNKNVEANNRLPFKSDVLTHVYTLVVYPNKTYAIKIDNKIERQGNLEDDYYFNPPKMIKDLDAIKPSDWNDTAEIDDPDDKKPDDWDQPEFITDPNSTKPSDWDDATDGEWEAAVIKNPKYKGEWQPRKIPNPDYKGEWIPPLKENPEYVYDESIAVYDNIGIIGIDVWQVKSGTVFDNILITDDEELASKKAEELIELYRNESKATGTTEKVEEGESDEETEIIDDEHKHEEL